MLSDPGRQDSTETAVEEIPDGNLLLESTSSSFVQLSNLDVPEVMKNTIETLRPEETTPVESRVMGLSSMPDTNLMGGGTSFDKPYKMLSDPILAVPDDQSLNLSSTSTRSSDCNVHFLETQTAPKKPAGFGQSQHTFEEYRSASDDTPLSYNTDNYCEGTGLMQSTTEIFRPAEIKLLYHIGTGGMSSISLYRNHKAKYPDLVAVKTLLPRLPARNESTLRYLKNELNILTTVDHKNIVRTFGTTDIQPGFGLVMEYLPNGCYSDFFANYWERLARTPEAHKELSLLKIRILEEIINAMEYLHRPRIAAQFSTKQSILHLDLKGENVLLDQHLHVKICDFGLSMMATLTKLRSSTTLHGGSPSGTAVFIAPERFLHPNSKPNTKCDIYSFGILQYTIVTDLPPYSEDISRKLALLVHHVTENNVRPNVDYIPTCYHTDLTKLMVKCWSQLPAERPTFKELRSQLHDILERNFKGFDEEASKSANSVLSKVHHAERLPDIVRDSRRPSPVPDNSGHWSPSRTSIPTSDSDAPFTQAETAPKRRLLSQAFDAGFGQHTLEEVVTSDDTPLVPDTGNSSGGMDLTKPLCSATKILLAVSVLVILSAVVIIVVVVPSIHNGNMPSGPCSAVTNPSHGKVVCEYQTANTTAKCQFSCDTGYAVFGDDTTSCIDGRWTQKTPLCEKVCHKLAMPKDGMATCTNKTFEGSNCSFVCRNNHIIKGKPTITCLKDGNWSDPAPSCVCPRCKVGDNCEDSISWQIIAGTLDNMQATGSIVVNYGGKSFSCHIEMHSLLPKLQWTGICVDSETGTEQDCKDGHTSKSGSAQAAAAELIRRLVAQKRYPEPCDADQMPTVC